MAVKAFDGRTVERDSLARLVDSESRSKAYERSVRFDGRCGFLCAGRCRRNRSIGKALALFLGALSLESLDLEVELSQICAKLIKVFVEKTAKSHGLVLKDQRELVEHIIKTLGGRNLSLVGEINKAGLEFIERLIKNHLERLVFITGLFDTVRVRVNVSQVSDHLLIRLESAESVWLVSFVQILLRISFGYIKDVIHSGYFSREVVGIDLEFANDLYVPKVKSRLNAIREL
jgi:hypothetical protein